MAQTLSEGPVIPDADGGEQISATGVNELRTLGASTNAALASVRAAGAVLAAEAEAAAAVAAQIGTDADSTSRARDLVLEGLIAGMEGMSYVGAWDAGATYRINDVVTHGGDSWARLTAGSTGEPGASPGDWGLVARKGDGGGFGELSETATDGLWTAVEGSMTPEQVIGLDGLLATKRDVAPMVIAEGTNLNDVNTPGEHSQQFTAWATPELNYPGGASPVAGRLFVAANVARTQVTQFYVPFTSSKLDIYMRNFYNSWGSWERIGMASDLALKANLTHPALYDSGWRNITSRVSGVASGKVLIRRTGTTVWVDFNDVLTTAPPANEWHTWSSFLPAGFGVFHDFTALPLAFTGARVGVRPVGEPQVNPDTLYNSSQALGPVRFDLNGRAIIYGARTGDGTAALTVRGMVSFPTNDAIPSSLPGTPA